MDNVQTRLGVVINTDTPPTFDSFYSPFGSAKAVVSAALRLIVFINYFVTAVVSLSKPVSTLPKTGTPATL